MVVYDWQYRTFRRRMGMWNEMLHKSIKCLFCLSPWFVPNSNSDCRSIANKILWIVSWKKWTSVKGHFLGHLRPQPQPQWPFHLVHRRVLIPLVSPPSNHYFMWFWNGRFPRLIHVIKVTHWIITLSEHSWQFIWKTFHIFLVERGAPFKVSIFSLPHWYVRISFQKAGQPIWTSMFIFCQDIRDLYTELHSSFICKFSHQHRCEAKYYFAAAPCVRCNVPLIVRKETSGLNIHN
jgi:hypothetical protein